MSIRRCFLQGGVAVTLLAALAACGEEPTSPGQLPQELSPAEASFIAMGVDGVGGAALGDHMAVFDALPAGAGGDVFAFTDAGPLGFVRVRNCPGGGQIEVDGEFDATFDGDTQTLEVSYVATKTLDGCTFVGDEDTYVVDGSVTIEATRTRVEGEPSGPQVTHIFGSITVTRESDGTSRSCEIDVTSIRDPDAGTRTVTGIVCGNEVDRTSDLDDSEG